MCIGSTHKTNRKTMLAVPYNKIIQKGKQKMQITSNRKVIATVNNLSELDSHILNTKCHTKPSNFISCKCIDYGSILSNETISEIQLMKLINKQFSKDSKNRSVRRKGFWIIRGFSDSEATQKVRDIQSKCAPSSKNYSGYVDLTDAERDNLIKNHQMMAGKEGGKVIANDATKRNTSIEYYLAKGLTLKDAEDALMDRQATFSLNKLSQTMTTSEAKRRIKDRNRLWFKSLEANNDMDNINRLKTAWLKDKKKLRQAIKKRKETMIASGQIIDPYNLSDMEYYYGVVWSYTRQQQLSKIKNIELRSSEWHLDHIYSIREGFLNNIPAYIIGNVHNLRIISATENCKKKAECHQTIGDILEKMKLDNAHSF